TPTEPGPAKPYITTAEDYASERSQTDFLILFFGITSGRRPRFSARPAAGVHPTDEIDKSISVKAMCLQRRAASPGARLQRAVGALFLVAGTGGRHSRTLRTMTL